MNIFGIGLLLVASGGFSLALILLLEAAGGIQLSWTTAHEGVLIFLGALLAAVGFYFWLSGVRMIRNAFYEKRLLTEGVYAHTRNPIYAAFILFLIPALSLLMNDALIVLASVILYAVFRINIGQEEDYLLQQFGNDYRRYAEEVPRLFPRFSRPGRI